MGDGSDDSPNAMTIFILNFYGPILTVFLVSLVFALFYLSKLRSTLKTELLCGQHIVITGGSSGIGKSVAIQAAERGANVTIIARDPGKLKDAKEEIINACISEDQKVVATSLDVSDNPEGVCQAFAKIEKELGPIFMLVNCAGMAVCGKMEDTAIDEFKHMMNLNYFGTLYPIKAVLPGMKERRSGHIVITSSQAGMIGIFGFTAYSASKFALRGLAEALDMETRHYGVKVTVSLPPDTDTPGYAAEGKNKPEETKLISQSSGLFSPDQVAKKLLDDVSAGKFFSTVGFEGFMLTTVCAGMSPVTSVFDTVSQVFLMGLFRLISVFYLLSFQSIVKKCMKTDAKNE